MTKTVKPFDLDAHLRVLRTNYVVDDVIVATKETFQTKDRWGSWSRLDIEESTHKNDNIEYLVKWHVKEKDLTPRGKEMLQEARDKSDDEDED